MKSTFIALSAAVLAIIVFGMNKPDYVKNAMRSLSLMDAEEPTSLSPRLAQQSNTGVNGASTPVFREIKRSARPVLDSVVTAATAATVDESALRYFASRGDTARLQAEISRLKALYPDWVPPKDPLAVPQNEDKQLETMWDLYAQSRYAEVRKAIAERQTAEPAWKPPADLIDRLTVAEARARLINASDLKQYDTVVRIGSETPSLLTCSEVDVLWRVAEAFFRTDKAQRATDAYGYILNNCQNAAERLATVQKAAAILPSKSVEDLLAKEKTAPDGTMEFDSIRDDLARRFVAEANADGKIVVPPQYLSRIERLAETGGLASDALLLGWYYLPRGDMEAAEKWFPQGARQGRHGVGFAGPCPDLDRSQRPARRRGYHVSLARRFQGSKGRLSRSHRQPSGTGTAGCHHRRRLEAHCHGGDQITRCGHGPAVRLVCPPR